MSVIPTGWRIGIYIVAFIVGSVASYCLIELRPCEPSEGRIIVNPTPSVVVRDTIETQVTKWRTVVKPVCCHDSTFIYERNAKDKIRKQETGAAKESRENSPSESTLEES